MGLPNINIIFKTQGLTAIQRSARGIVAVIIKDDTAGGKSLETYKSITEVDYTKYTARNYEYLKLIYAGAPALVIVARIGTSETDISAALSLLQNLKWNYIVMPEITSAQVLTLSTWIKEQRATKKTFKAVLPNSASDHEGIINFTTNTILSEISNTAFTTSEYCARIAGLLAGLSLSRSATYFVLSDIMSAAVPTDANSRIDAGELVIIFDGEKYKIGRGVNSLTSFTIEKGEDLRKIKIIEGIDLYNDDVRNTFEKYYVGKLRNDYDNKQAFVAAVNAYNTSLAGDVLDSSYDNLTTVDIEAQKAYLESKGKDTSLMSEIEIARANTGSNVFVIGNLRFVDAMEDLTMVNHM